MFEWVLNVPLIYFWRIDLYFGGSNRAFLNFGEENQAF